MSRLVSRQRLFGSVLVTMIIVLAIASCAPTATAAPRVAGVGATAGATVAPMFTSVPMVQTVAVTSASAPHAVATYAPAGGLPAATQAPAATEAPYATPVPVSAPGGGLPSQPYASNRMIIKSGEMDLQVVDTDVAVSGVTQVAVDMSGYILSGRTWFQDNYKFAQITIGVPSDQYENALNRIRHLGIQVLRETSSGQDVSEEYVDLDSRLRNLQAQADRLRGFMGQAKDVSEAITVSTALSDVESQIEQIQGRMNYLQGRSAYSTITVNVEPQRPTPTPTSTPTVTPTPTPTSTPTTMPTPTSWAPGETVNRAGETSLRMWQSLFDVAIWLAIVIGPFLLLSVPVIAGVRFATRRNGRGPRPPAGG